MATGGIDGKTLVRFFLKRDPVAYSTDDYMLFVGKPLVGKTEFGFRRSRDWEQMSDIRLDPGEVHEVEITIRLVPKPKRRKGGSDATT